MNQRLLDVAHRGDITELQALLNKDDFLLERSSLDVSSETILHVAVLANQTAFVKVLLDKKKDLATRLDQDGFSPIHIASTNGFVEIVTEMLKANHNLGKLKSSDGRTSLHCAAITGRVDVIKELLEFCPESMHAATFKGETALHLAIKNNQLEAFKFMIDNLKELNIKELLNVRDKNGNTVLHHATAKMQIMTLELLLGGGEIDKGTIEVNAINKCGLTALDVLDVVQQMVADHFDYTLWELLQNAGALRAKQLHPSNLHHSDASTKVTHHHRPIQSAPQNFGLFLLDEVKLLNPASYWRRLAEQVQKSRSETQNALMVVAVLVATLTFQAILTPPNGNYEDTEDYHYVGAKISGSMTEFIVVMVLNSIAFFASLAVINLLIHEFPLKPLLGLAMRCMAASYISGIFIIGPSNGSNSGLFIYDTDWVLLVIDVMVLIDFIRFLFRLFRRQHRVISNEN